MNEQHNNNEKKTGKLSIMPTKNKGKKETLLHKFKKMNKEKRFYLCTAVSCAVAFLAIFIIVLAVTNSSPTQQGGKDNTHNSADIDTPSGGSAIEGDGNQDRYRWRQSDQADH